MKSKLLIISIIYGFILLIPLRSQEKLYSNEFPLSDVKLLNGPFKHAQDLNTSILLKYNPDRFLAPYQKVAGLNSKADNYENWENQGLDGHVGGHYLSALAIHFASTGNPELKERLEYMLTELKSCQKANGIKYPDWGVGYVGAVPGSDSLWTGIKAGEIERIWDYWVPWYNIHKMFVGLRDAWLFAGEQRAKDMFLEFCNWAVDLTASLSDEQMESMLNNEYGGMNEVLADAYHMTGDKKFLNAAMRFSHKRLLIPLSKKTDNLDNLHANTQVPKAIGIQRIAELSGDQDYKIASEFFWETVVKNRSLAFGGNSRREFFPSTESCTDFIHVPEGPESCNTYNMLRLTKGLFREEARADYADYYERALYNHILSTQHPEHGGYVYFTPARPRHYRVYSAPNAAMWCCVGTGLENHGKYGQFIYTHHADSLYVNLFIASELQWKDKGILIQQSTDFPDEESSRLTFTLDSVLDFTLKLRHPYWVDKDQFKVFINGKELDVDSEPSSYVSINRTWKDEDSVRICLPMKTRLEKLINVSNYYAFMHGPLLLGAKTENMDIPYFVAGKGRWEHIAHGEMLPLHEAPIILEENVSYLGNKLLPSGKDALSYSMSKIEMLNAEGNSFLLEPFFRIHDSRYMIYWNIFTPEGYEDALNSIARAEQKKLYLEERTLDYVQPGEQQPESDHFMKSKNSHTGVHMDEFWRDAQDGGYFSYKLKTNGETKLNLLLKYWGTNWGYRTFDILIDDELLSTENVRKWNIFDFREEVYTIPECMLEGKEEIRVRFQAPEKGIAGAIYFVRLFKSGHGGKHDEDSRKAENPIIWADIPDMSIIRVGSSYYMSSTTMHMSPGVPIMKSPNLVDWKLVNYAYDTLVNNDALSLQNGENAYGKGSWASCLRFHNDEFILSTFSSTSGKTHIYRTRDIEDGLWKEQNFRPSLHDHTIFFDEKDKAYIIWGGGKIYIAELEDDLSGVKEKTTRILIENASAPSGTDMMLPAEGSQLFKVHDYYYLFNISWPRNGMRTVIVHRAKSLIGPWEGKVVLQDRGIAQGGLIDTPEGKWYAYMFRDYGSVGRIPYLVPVRWENAWPVLGEKGKVPDTLDIQKIEQGIPGIVSSDEFDKNEDMKTPSMAWQWNHNPQNDYWSLTERPGYLRLKTWRIDEGFLSARNTLTQRTFGPSCQGTIKMDFSYLKEGDYSGLAALQKNYGFIGVKKSNGKYYLVMVDGTVDKPTEVDSVIIDQQVIYLRVEMDYTNQKDKATFSYSLNGSEWIEPGHTIQMSYTLPHFMGYRFALFNYATSNTGGYVDIDYFKIE